MIATSSAANIERSQTGFGSPTPLRPTMATPPRYAVIADDFEQEYDSAYEDDNFAPAPCVPCDDNDVYEDEGYADDPEEEEIFTEHEYTDRSDPTPRAAADLSEESYRTANELFSDRSDPTPRVAGKADPKADLKDQDVDADNEEPQNDAAAIYDARQPDEAAPLPDMAECACCNRRFRLDRLPRHEEACRRAAERQKKRKAFDPRAQRWQGDADAEQAVQNAVKRGLLDKPDPEAQASQREAKRKKWQKQSLQIRRAAAAAKDGGATAPMLAEADDDDRVPCPHCGRKFAALPAERHIAKCKDIRAKPQTIKRSLPKQGPSPREEAPAAAALPAAKGTAPATAPKGKAKEPQLNPRQILEAKKAAEKAAEAAPVAKAGSKPVVKVGVKPAADASAGSAPSADPPAVEAGAARLAERMAGRVSPFERLAGRESPVPSLDFSKLGGSHKPAPAAESAASEVEEDNAPSVLNGAPPVPSPPPPNELDQLHALGDAKFGKHNKFRPSTGAQPKRPSVAPAAAPAAVGAPVATKGWDASPPVKPPPGRKPVQAIGDVVVDDASAKKPVKSSGYGPAKPAPPKRSMSGASSSGSASGDSPIPSPARPAAAPKPPAARRSSNASRSVSPATTGGRAGAVGNPSPTSNRSNTGSSRPSSRNASPIPGQRVQASAGMRPPTVLCKPGQRRSSGGSPVGPSSLASLAPPAGSSNRSAGSQRSNPSSSESRSASPTPAKRPPKAPAPMAPPPAPLDDGPPARQPMAIRSINSQNIESGQKQGGAPQTACKPRRAPSTKDAAPIASEPKAPSAALPFFHVSSRDVAAADEASFEEKAKACQSPTPFGRAGATLFDRQSSGVLTRRSSFAAAEEKQAADVSYKEVRIERFGWRRSSFISRSDSPMLVR